jgi:predicted GNAT family acetyltransferase
LWKQRALPFLRKKEAWNNLFWQIIKQRENSSSQGWSGNIFCEEEVKLSALHTPSNFLLLSHGRLPAVQALAQYAIEHKWKVSGVTGPETVVNHFLKCTQKCIPLSGGNAVRTFKLFKTQTVKKNEKFGDYKLGPVSNLDWAKVRVWAQKFALEAEPPMDLSAITQMVTKLNKEKNLFTLNDPQNYPCAMAGFGRSTERFRVINLVYVPKDLRGSGIGRELISRMTNHARTMGYEECILFSEWQGKYNMYESMGCKELGNFAEYDLS